MKTFEIEVVRSYTTTIEVETADHLTASDVRRITMYNDVLEEEEDIYDEIWEIIAEKELEQMDTDMLNVKAKEIKSGEQLFNELGFTSEKG
jgi:hypothetical protein|tara:strand:- start:45 stop:317 length:273 start_codon:yes stop_codon:yes gene_type:complete